jgi:predicted nucleotidyltransferase
MPGTSAGSTATPLRRLGERAAAALARYEDVVAVCLLGSVARGDARGDSDIDLLVVTETAVRRSHLIRRLPPSARDDRLSLICFSTEQWWDEVRRRSLFLHHVRLEGETIYDPDEVLHRGLASAGIKSCCHAEGRGFESHHPLLNVLLRGVFVVWFLNAGFFYCRFVPNMRASV